MAYCHYLFIYCLFVCLFVCYQFGWLKVWLNIVDKFGYLLLYCVDIFGSVLQDSNIIEEHCEIIIIILLCNYL